MRGRRRTWGCAAVAGIAASVAIAGPAAAATIPVTFDLDQSVDNTNCSLREAITSANTNSNAHEDACVAGQPAPAVDTVELLGTSYEILGNGDNSNTAGDFDINASAGPLVIDGEGEPFSPATSIDADNTDRIFQVQGDDDLVNQITIRDIILDDGQITDDAGGIIRLGQARLTLDSVIVQNGSINGVNPSVMRGAGLASVADGVLTIRNSDFNDNVISAAAAGAGAASGGGIYLGPNAGATIDRSSISDNGISGDGTGVGDFQALIGAGISTDTAGEDLTITNSLIAANAMLNGDTQIGGGVEWDESGGDDTLRLTNVTFSANFAGSGNGGALTAFGPAAISHTTFGPNTAANGAGLYISNGPVQLRSSLLETNTADDCGGPVDPVALGFNIERGPENDCHFPPMSTDVLVNAPILNPLDDNGGPWQTHRLEFDFFDAIPLASCVDAVGAPLTQDTRGAPRQFDDGILDSGPECDPGAFEEVQCQGEPAFVIGTPGADTITGTAGTEIILGLDGADTILPGSGSDRICAGDGDDTLAGGDDDVAPDFYGGGTGSDTYDLTDSTAPLTVNLATGAVQPSATLGNEVIDSLENVIGGDDNDALTGDAGPNRLDGFAGDDTITGAGGFDQLLGNIGNLDALFARDGGGDAVDCGPGTADTAQTDRLSLDSVIGCESVDALAEPAVLLPTPPPQQPPAAKKKCKKGQKLRRGKCVKKKRKK